MGPFLTPVCPNATTAGYEISWICIQRLWSKQGSRMGKKSVFLENRKILIISFQNPCRSLKSVLNSIFEPRTKIWHISPIFSPNRGRKLGFPTGEFTKYMKMCLILTDKLVFLAGRRPFTYTWKNQTKKEVPSSPGQNSLNLYWPKIDCVLSQGSQGELTSAYLRYRRP